MISKRRQAGSSEGAHTQRAPTRRTSPRLSKVAYRSGEGSGSTPWPPPRSPSSSHRVRGRPGAGRAAPRRQDRGVLPPFGATIVVKELGETYSQSFLQGHTDEISCLAISRDGRMLASGQITNMGFSADIIVWDLEARAIVHRMSLHKVKVAELSFSYDGKYLASLGGQDDNSLVIWDVETGNAVCGTPTPGLTRCLRFFNNTNFRLVTGGGNTLVVWDFDRANRKLRPMPCRLGSIRRDTNYITVDDNVRAPPLPSVNPVPDLARFPHSVRPSERSSTKSLTLAPPSPPSSETGRVHVRGHHLRRCPSGVSFRATLQALRSAQGAHPQGRDHHRGGTRGRGCRRRWRRVRLRPRARLHAHARHHQACERGYFLRRGARRAQGWRLRYVLRHGVVQRLLPQVVPHPGDPLELIQTCHAEQINDVAFPLGYSEVFATCGSTDVRVWHINEARELLRIRVPNVECLSVGVHADGGSIISGWNDGKIRAFAPQSGRLLYTINDAHPHGVTCLLGSSDCTRIVSGGKEGNVGAVAIGPESQTMLASMKEHKGPVNCLALRANDSECVSASSDGSAIIWDLTRYIRGGALTANTFFKACAYHPDESQIVTAGTDRQVTWWDTFDAQAIRVLDGSDSAEINSLDISTSGEMVVTGGGDKEVKVWGYDEGACFSAGKGHSGAITKVKFTPDGEKIVSVGAEGAIFIWQNALAH